LIWETLVEGIEEMTPEEKQKSCDFSGQYVVPQYAATEATLRSNSARYDELSVCFIHKGWFAETLAVHLVPDPVRVMFIDCDLAKGTREVLSGVVPELVDDGWIFSQDFPIKVVRELLSDPDTWEQFGKGYPRIIRLYGYLASLRFAKG
jgi:hypothetical protein